MKDRRGSGGGNGGRSMSGCSAAGLTLSHRICGSLSDKAERPSSRLSRVEADD
jgi:hypothetical protein